MVLRRRLEFRDLVVYWLSGTDVLVHVGRRVIKRIGDLLIQNCSYVGSYWLLVLVIFWYVLGRKGQKTWGEVVLVEEICELRVEFLSKARKWRVYRRICLGSNFWRNEVGLRLDRWKMLRVAKSNGKRIAGLGISFGVHWFAGVLLRLYIRRRRVLSLALKL